VGWIVGTIEISQNYQMISRRDGGHSSASAAAEASGAGASGSTADAGAPSADPPSPSKIENPKSEMGPVSNSFSPVRGGGHGLSAVREEPGAGGSDTFMSARDETRDGDETRRDESCSDETHSGSMIRTRSSSTGLNACLGSPLRTLPGCESIYASGATFGSGSARGLQRWTGIRNAGSETWPTR